MRIIPLNQAKAVGGTEVIIGCSFYRK